MAINMDHNSILILNGGSKPSYGSMHVFKERPMFTDLKMDFKLKVKPKVKMSIMVCLLKAGRVNSTLYSPKNKLLF